MKLKFVTLIVFCCISLLSFKIADDDITADEVLAHIKYLASDELAGRFPGTEGDSLAEQYIIDRFKSYNLIPAGDDEYRERFNFISEIKTDENNVFKLINEDGDISVSKPERDFIPLSFSPNGRAQGELVFAGYGINAPDLNYNDFQNIDLKNKIAVIFRYSPGYSNPHDNKFSAYESMYKKCKMVLDAGASGLIVITGPESGDDELIPLRTSNESTSLPALSVKREVLSKYFSVNLKTLQQQIDSLKKPNSFKLKNVKADFTVSLMHVQANTANVIGYLEGNDPVLKNEVIVIGAHLDHLGDGMKYGSLYEKHVPAIHNGADDNASGDAGVMELAQKMSSVKSTLKRSYIFMCFSGEEAGLLGSSFFVKSEIFKKYNIITMINMDMIGRLTDNKLTVGGTGTSSIWDNIVDSLNGISGFTLAKDKSGFGPSDHSSFNAKSVPVLFFFTGLHKDYHRPSDDWNLINAEGEVKVLQMVYSTLMTLDKLSSKPDYIKSEEPKQDNRGFRVTLGIIPDYSSSGEGLQILGVKAGSAGEKAGLQANDIIIKFGNSEIKNIYDYTSELGNYKPGDETNLTIKRGTEVKDLKVRF